MSYYGAGDYYGAGGFFDFIGGAVKKIGGVALGVGASLIPGGSAALNLGRSIIGGGGGGQLQLPTIRPGAILPGGVPFASQHAGAWPTTKDGRPRRMRKDGKPWKRPTMDPGNSKAMRRAVRRSERFVGLARSALSNTKWKVASRSSGTRRKK